MLASREPKDRTFFPDTDPNVGVEILFLSSVALISNMGLLAADAITVEPNEKDLTYKKNLNLNYEQCHIKGEP